MGGRSDAAALFFAYSFGLGGTFAPFLRASERPMAMACFGLVTFFPLRPLFSLPCFISRISVSTCLPAEGLYLRADFFAGAFFAAFFVEDFFAGDFFIAFLVADFLLAFLVAMWVEPPVKFERMCTNFVASGSARFAQNDVQTDEQADAERYVENTAMRAAQISIAPCGVGEVEIGGEAGDGDGGEGGRGVGAGSDG